MVSSKEDILCEQAKFYYYDLLFQEGHRIVPEFITNHFKQCQHCQKQIHQLNRALKNTDSVNQLEQIKSGSEISNILKLHFTYLNQPVNCEITKPFLPNLLDPVLAIRIPTPITVHLDHCEGCVKDLKTIQNLELNRAQLYRLSQLLSDKQSIDKTNCQQAQTSIMAFVFLTFSEIDKKDLNHLCICPECRKVLYQFRKTIKEEILNKEGDNKECFLFDQIPYNRKFDYVVPYGLDFTNIKTFETQRSLIFHLRRCPTCLTKIQELHKKIYNIKERSESGVVTIYKTTESGQTQEKSRFKNLYEGYPIDVELVGRRNIILAERSYPIINFTKAVKQRILNTNLKSGIKVGSIAAILLVALTLSLHTSSVKALSLAKIFSNAEKHENVYISIFSPGKTEPTKERWISRSLNFKIYKTGDELALSDFTNKEEITKNLTSGLNESRPLTQEQITNFKFSIQYTLSSGSTYFLPNDELRHITNLSITENGDNYEITWREEHYNMFVDHRLKVFTDSASDLPFRMENYSKISTDEKYNLDTITTFQYLSEAELAAVKDQYF